MAPSVAVLTGVGAAGAAIVAILRPNGTDLLVVLLAGSVVLGYGWANVGIAVGGIPLPITQMMLAVIVPYAVWRMRSIFEPGWPAIFLLAFVAFASVRLIFDYPVWGIDAIRDFTTPLEMLVFFAGYWAIKERGIAWAIQIWTVVLLILVCYAALYPWRDAVGALGPTVGLQRDVPLLHYSGLAGGVSAAFLASMILLRWPLPAGLVSMLAIWFVAVIQLRGLYLFLPTALAVAIALQTTARAQWMTGMRLALIGTASVISLLVISAADLNVTGRMGQLGAGFAQQQIATLRGTEGPGAGSFRHRLEWTDIALDEWRQSIPSRALGVGLGPDLTGGFTVEESVAVRKPHNDYVELLARYGLAGAGLWLAFITIAMRRCIKAIRDETSSAAEREFLTWAVASGLVYLLIAATQPYLAFPYGTVPLFTLLGMATAVAAHVQPDESEVCR